MNVGSGGGGAAAAPTAGGGGAAAAAEEAPKEEEKEEGMALEQMVDVVRMLTRSREGRVRRGYGLRSLRLSARLHWSLKRAEVNCEQDSYTHGIQQSRYFHRHSHLIELFSPLSILHASQSYPCPCVPSYRFDFAYLINCYHSISTVAAIFPSHNTTNPGPTPFVCAPLKCIPPASNSLR